MEKKWKLLLTERAAGVNSATAHWEVQAQAGEPAALQTPGIYKQSTFQS